jgi:hypothetical protein
MKVLSELLHHNEFVRAFGNFNLLIVPQFWDRYYALIGEDKYPNA